MDPLSTVTILLGALIIATRGPMIIAPTATLSFFAKILSSNVRIRMLAATLAPLAAALAFLPLGEGQVAALLRILGWLWAAAAVWLLAAPESYRHFAQGVLSVFENSGNAVVRVLGIVAVAIGSSLIYFGLYVA